MHFGRTGTVVFVALTLSILPEAVAAEDPPAKVARLSYLSGSVSFKPGPLEDWSAATLNYPLTSGDQLWTERSSRAELRDGRLVMQLGPETALTVYWLDNEVSLLGLAQGTIFLRVNRLGPDDSFEVTTPNAAISLMKAGTYRIDVDPSGQDTRVTVRGSEAEVTAAGSWFSVGALQEAKIIGPLAACSYDIVDAPLPDEFDRWCRDRYHVGKNSATAQHVAPAMIGSEDLDANGSWKETPDYAWVWQPTAVVEGWVPYRYGRWAWVEPWGWNWVDDAAWGFAPFHYGRWAWWDGGWVWAPGPIARPVYAPALVAFVGGEGWSASLSFGTGGVAWFPLAPGEPFIPVYGVSPYYLRSVNVNIINVNVTNVAYANRGVTGAVTAVPRDTVVGGRPVGPAAMVVAPRAVVAAPIVGSAPPVAPRPESITGAAPGASQVPRPPATVLSRPLVSKAGAPPAIVPFTARQQVLNAHPGRPLDRATLASLRGSPSGNLRPAFVSATAAGANTLRPAREGLAATHAAQPSPFKPGVARPPTATRNTVNPNTKRPLNANAVPKKPGASQGGNPAPKPKSKAVGKPVKRPPPKQPSP